MLLLLLAAFAQKVHFQTETAYFTQNDQANQQPAVPSAERLLELLLPGGLLHTREPELPAEAAHQNQEGK